MSSLSKFLSKQDQDLVVKAIEKAELNTSGEIRVHVESKCEGEPIEKAVTIFNKLKMYKTELRNGVLLYIAYDSHKLAIVGDQGINDLVPEDFWDHVVCDLSASFANGNILEGILEAVTLIGEKLKDLFPYNQDDINEQSNEISFGD